MGKEEGEQKKGCRCTKVAKKKKQKLFLVEYQRTFQTNIYRMMKKKLI
jgi:hypothetical protein